MNAIPEQTQDNHSNTNTDWGLVQDIINEYKQLNYPIQDHISQNKSEPI